MFNKVSNKKKYVIKNTAGMFDLHKGLAMIIVMLVHTLGLFPALVSPEILQSDWDGYINSISMNHYMLYIALSFGAVFYSLFVETLMPCLLIMSGYGFRKTTIKKSVSKQFSALIIPYLITMFLTSFLHMVFHYAFYRGKRVAVFESIKVFVGFALGLPRTIDVANVRLFSNGPIWFLLALFWGLILFNILVTYIPQKYLPLGAVGVSTIGWLLGRFGVIPFCITQGLVSVIYIYVGYYAKKNKVFIDGPNTKRRKLFIIGAFLLEMFLHMIGNYFGMAEDMYRYGIISIIGKALLSIVTVYVVLFLNRFRGKISSIIRFAGHYSIYILCIHTLEMKAFPSYLFAEAWDEHPGIGFWVHAIIRIVSVLLICYIYVNAKDRIITVIREKREKKNNV